MEGNILALILNVLRQLWRQQRDNADVQLLVSWASLSDESDTGGIYQPMPLNHVSTSL